MKNLRLYLQHFAVLAVSLLTLELLFRLYAGFDFHYTTIIRVILFDIGIASIVALGLSFIDLKISKWLAVAFVFIMAVYAFVELEFKNFLDNYYSFAAVSDGVGRISDYVLTFLADARWYYWTVFIVPLVLGAATFIFRKQRGKECPSIKIFALSLIVTVISIVGSIYSLNYSNTAVDLLSTYKRFSNNDLLIDKLGIEHFLVRDVVGLFVEADTQIELVIEEVDEETEDITEDDSVKVVDDSQLEADYEAEEDETIKMIDEYILASDSTQVATEHTGEFEGMNFIYILVESFDYIAIDPVLTPTLYKMMTEGYWFSEHYTPKYSCTTGESEFIANVSLVPYNDVCTPNVVGSNDYPEALASLFSNAGYDTYSFHNWIDQYYDRKTEHASFGFDAYYNFDDLPITEIQGWQSDLELVEVALPYFIDSEQFFAFFVSSSTHWPYDESSTLGDKYLSEINAVYPDYPIEVKRYLSKAMEFDKAMEYLLEQLEEYGKLENTVICLFSDHNPYKLSDSDIITYSTLVDRSDTYGISKTPFIIYNPSLTATEFTMVNSTFDQTPTLADMFGLDYDKRLYIGSNIFAESATVIFPNGDWITDEGIYIVATDTFMPFGDEVLSSDEIASINLYVSNSINLSYAIMDSNYFSKRSYLASPTFLDP